MNTLFLFQRKRIFQRIITREYVYNNIKLNETRNTVENTLQEYKLKYAVNYRRHVKVKCVAVFLDKIKTETKNITIERYNIFGELNEIKQSSDGMCKLIRIIELKIKIERVIQKNETHLCLKSGNIPILWKKNFMKIANDRDILYNRPRRFIQCARERHFWR